MTLTATLEVKMATKKKKRAKKLATYDPLLGIVYADGKATVRHMGRTRTYPQPLCGEAGRYWSASASAATHALPICQKCVKHVRKMQKLLDSDLGHQAATVGKEKMLEDAKTGFMELLADYEAEFTSEDAC